MSLRITRSPQALIDVIERAYYVSDNAGLNASDNFLKAVESAYKQLADMPGLGSSRDYGPAYPGLRRWHVPKFPKYLIFYQATETDLVIRRVLHGAQDIEQIFTSDED